MMIVEDRLKKRKVFAENKRERMPMIELNREKLIMFASLLVPVDEILAYFGCTIEVLDTWAEVEFGTDFETFCKHYAIERKVQLRKIQFSQAEEDVRMSIFLGKNILNQADKVDTKTDVKQTVVIVDDIDE